MTPDERRAFHAEMDAAYNEWLRELADEPARMPATIREALAAGDDARAAHELAVHFLAEQLEEAMAASDEYVSCSEPCADGTLKRLWHTRRG